MFQCMQGVSGGEGIDMKAIRAASSTGLGLLTPEEAKNRAGTVALSIIPCGQSTSAIAKDGTHCDHKNAARYTHAQCVAGGKTDAAPQTKAANGYGPDDTKWTVAGKTDATPQTKAANGYGPDDTRWTVAGKAGGNADMRPDTLAVAQANGAQHNGKRAGAGGFAAAGARTDMRPDTLATAQANGAQHNGKRAGKGSFSGWNSSNARRDGKPRKKPSGCKFPGCGYPGFHGSAGCPLKKRMLAEEKAKKQKQ